MKSAVFYALILALLHGDVLAGISYGGEIKTTSKEAKMFPKTSKAPTSETSFSGRIVNGKNASIENHPYTVHLRVTNGKTIVTCGASVITYSHALTVAHCVYKESAASITLYGGSTSRSRGGTVFYVSKVVVHPNYNHEILENDAAILKVKNSFRGYPNIAPIALQNGEVPAGTTCYVTGWGLTNYDTETEPDNLQYAVLQVLSSEACREAWSDLSSIICAQRRKGVDICQGDSGGPLVCNGRLTGSSSFVDEGCRGEYPSGFAKVMYPSIRQFIKKHAGI